MIPWHVAPTRDEAYENAADAVMWYIRRQVNLVAPPDYYDARHASHRVLGAWPPVSRRTRRSRPCATT